jgi:coproporphyrinogen III oxidase
VRTRAASNHAAQALTLVEGLQQRFGAALERVSRRAGAASVFSRVEWLRDGGRHGGGERLATGGDAVYDRASVNVSQVHYDDLPDRKLASATALSAIVHPRHPRAPSVHLHASFTEMRDSTSYWRIMADLNPSHPDEVDATIFRDAWRAVAPALAASAEGQGDRYFAIPALGRTRGVTHFYLEAYTTGDFAADLALAKGIEEAAIDTYTSLVSRQLARAPAANDAERSVQRAYHTLYLFQVLTLDRGTTSGLLVHDENDLGILGSLPSEVDPALMAQWAARVPPPQEELVHGIVAALGPSGAVTDEAKRALAEVARTHYRRHPAAIELQARGDVVPPTVANHQA